MAKRSAGDACSDRKADECKSQCEAKYGEDLVGHKCVEDEDKIECECKAAQTDRTIEGKGKGNGNGNHHQGGAQGGHHHPHPQPAKLECPKLLTLHRQWNDKLRTHYHTVTFFEYVANLQKDYTDGGIVGIPNI